MKQNKRKASSPPLRSKKKKEASSPPLPLRSKEKTRKSFGAERFFAPFQREKKTHPSSVNFIAPSANCCIFWLRSSVALSPFLMIASMSSSVSDAASDEKTISAP